MPRQNRPLVRDGRLQAPKKKRTDRSYLGGPAKAPADAPAVDDTPLDVEDVELESDADVAAEVAEDEVNATETAPEAPVASPEPIGAVAASSVQASRAASGRLPTSVRAMQQQGVRKRRELDVDALAERDTRYAVHELRRIAILTAMVIVTLVVLTIVLR